MAVREGFEPSIRLQTVYSLSRGAPSASRPPHRLKMARSGGFEPPTAWFVARYSIQLSYERVNEETCKRYSNQNDSSTGY